MIDPTVEHILFLPQAAQAIPGRPHYSTLSRWGTRGVQGKRLETIKIGGRRATSREALARFFAALTAAGQNDSRPAEATETRQRAIERAERDLADSGFEKAKNRDAK